MQANEFEKKVQQKMDELQLYPSAGVWPEVEKRIRRQKRRRRIIFWWLLPLLLAGGGTTLLIMTREDKDNTHASGPATTLTNTTPKENSTNTTSIPETKDPAPVTNKPVAKETKGQDEKRPPVPVITLDAKPVLPATKKGKQNEWEKQLTDKGNAFFDQQAGAKKKVAKKQKMNNEDTGRPEDKKDTMEASAKPVSDVALTPKKETGENENKKFLPVTKEKPLIDKRADSVLAADKKTVAPADSGKEKEPVTKTPQKKKQDWEWGIHAASGISGRASGFSLFPQAKAEMLNSGNPGANPQAPVPPGKSSNGLYAMAGVNAKKKLGRKTAVSVGIDFSYYSTRQQTGVFVDSSRLVYAGDYSANATGYYRNGTASNRHSNYFFVSTPISIHWQLNKGKKIPLVWENSLSPRILLGSNALVYDAAYNIYYRDKGIFRKFQLSYQTGIYAQFGQATKHPFATGLFLNYHISQLQKVETDNRNHLLSFGVQVKWTLKK